MIAPYFHLLSTSPDSQHTVVGQLCWTESGGCVEFFCFCDSELRHRWASRAETTRARCAWCHDSLRVAVYHAGHLWIFDVHTGLVFERDIAGVIDGLFLTRSGELVVHSGTRLSVYSPITGLPLKLEANLLLFDWRGGDYAYCDPANWLYFNGRRIGRYAANTGPGSNTDNSTRLYVASDRLHLLSSSGTDSGTVKARTWRVTPVEGEVITDALLMLPPGATQWMLRESTSVLSLVPSEDGCISIFEQSLEGGAARVIGSVRASAGRLGRGVDGGSLLWLETAGETRVACIRDGKLESFTMTRGDICHLQADSSGVRAAVLASGNSSGWHVQIAGRTVLGLNGDTRNRAPYSPARGVFAGVRARGILYVPPVFGPRTTWAQTTCFHHVLSEIANSLRDDGYAYRAARIPLGARISDASSLAIVVSGAVRASLDVLRAAGCERIAIVAGSIGAYAILRDLTLVEGVAAVMLLSPVHFISPAISARLRFEAYDDDAEGILEERRKTTDVPILIVHGVRDEVTPSYHSFVFSAAAARSKRNEYHPVPDEGHVFARFESWRLVVERFRAFAAVHCGVDATYL